MSKKELTFEEAIQVATLWCNAWEREELSDEVLADRIGELIGTKIGARGFFVVSLSSNSPLMDRLPEALVFKLIEGKEVVVDLTVRNLAMSTAMAIEHKRNNDLEKEYSSKRVAYRCIELLKLLETNSVKSRIEKLSEATKGYGEDIEFLNRWGYDQEQINAINQNILLITS